MFGCHAIYSGEKIMVILRNKEDVHPECNGVWIATSNEHHASLKKEFPMMTSIALLTVPGRETEWQMIPIADDNFESAVLQLCEMIRRGDERIGRIPKAKKKSPKKKK